MNRTDLLLIAVFVFFKTPVFGVQPSKQQLSICYDSLQQFENYSIEDGLPHNRVLDILEDKYGYIWIATVLGLSRFDGIHFVNYFHNALDPLSISNNTILALAEDRQGQLWIDTQNGFNKLDRKTATFIRYYRDLLDQSILDSLEKELKFQYFDQQERFTFIDSQGNKWEKKKEGIYVTNRGGSKVTIYPLIPNNPIALTTCEVRKIYEDRKGNFWLATNNGVNYLNREQEIQHIQSLQDNITAIVPCSRTNTLWIGTANSGLFKYNMLSREFDENWKPFYETPQSISHLFLDKDHSLWITSKEIKEIFILNTLTYERDKSILPKSIGTIEGTTILQTTRGAILIGTKKKGIFKFDKQHQQLTRYISPNLSYDLTGDAITCLFEDSACHIWIGTKAGTLHRIHSASGATKHFSEIKERNKSLKPDFEGQINCVFEDSQKRIWVGGKHLSLYNEQFEDFTHYSAAFDNPFNQVTSITEDRYGKLWIGTNKGLYVFSNTTKSFTYLGIEENILGLEFSKAACQLADGTIVKGSNKGFNLISVGATQKTNNEINLTLYDWVAAEDYYIETVPNDTLLTLAHYQNTIQLKASLGSFDKGYQFKYKLSGYEKKWTVHPAHERLIAYDNLPPGNYVLQVIADSKYGGVAEVSHKISFSIAQPFWNTKWFYLLSFIGSIFGVYKGIQWQYKRLLANKKNKLQLQFLRIKSLQAHMNPHFVFNVLGSIQNEVLNGDRRIANQNIVRLSTLIRHFLDSSASWELEAEQQTTPTNEITLEKELELLKMYIEFEQLQYKNRFVYELEVAPILNPGTTKLPPMIIQPFVENAIKHGLLKKDENGTLNIQFFATEATELIVRIMDDGIGRTKAKQIQSVLKKHYKSLGTSLVKQRVTILNQLGYQIDLQTVDRPGGGTLVTIKLNRKHAH